MLTRRTFFERLSTLPLVGGFLGGAAHSAEAAVPVARDYFKELGVRPFINAAGTFTDMTASLMPPGGHDGDQLRVEGVRAAQRAARPGRRADRDPGEGRGGHGVVRRRVGDDARHGRRAHRRRSEEDRRPAEPGRHEDRGHHAEGAPVRVRPRGAQLRREDRRGRDRGRTRGRDHAADGDDAVLQQQQLGRADSRRGVRAPRQEARRGHDERLRRRRAAGREPVEVHRHGLRPGRLLGRQGHPRSAERRPAARAQGPDRRRPRQRRAQRQQPSAAG